ncbi:MAG: CAP domain-containing protein [Armatimonadota bacterium]|nr:CAP domain-containing protein [Armatimonadota bacterium]
MRRARRIAVVMAALLAASLAHARGATTSCPPKARQMLADARVLLSNGDERGALSKVQQAVELAPAWPPPHAELGLLYQRQGDEERARHHYTQHQLLGLMEPESEPDDLTRQIAEGEALLIYLANEERAARRLRMLRPDLTLTEMARQHSEEMCELGYFSHASPIRRNSSLQRRYRNAFNCRPKAIAENVSRMRGTLWSFIPENLIDSHDRLMASAGHSQNILWERVDSIGVGIAVNDRGDFWITEDFALLEQ